MHSYPTQGLCELPTAILKVDPNVQGTFDPKWAEKIAARWNSEAYGVVEVSFRDGGYYVYNHQHVLAAARQLGPEKVPTLRCYVRSGLSVQQEAEGWIDSNLAVKVKSGADRFRMRLQALDETALEVNAACAEAGVGIRIGGTASAGVTGAVAAMTAVCRKGGRGLLTDTLVIARTAWPEDRFALSAVTLRAVGDFLWSYRGHPRYSRDRLVLVLSGHPALSIRQQLTEVGGNTAWSRPGRTVLLDLYNSRLTTNALPELTMSDLKRITLGRNPWA